MKNIAYAGVSQNTEIYHPSYKVCEDIYTFHDKKHKL